MMTCLLGLFGTVKAQETITIGERSNKTNLLPTDCLYDYSFTQQIYTASEIGTGAGTITKIAFNQESANTYTRNLTIYMLNTDKETFDSNKDLVEVTESDIVFNGDITTTTNMSWLEIELDNEFNYEGGNILLCVQDNSGSYNSSYYFSTYEANNRTLQIRRDGKPLNYETITSLSPSKLNFVNVLQIEINAAGSGPSISAPKNVAASKEELFIGDYTTISWNAIENNEYLYGYNVYFTDGTIINGEKYVTKVNNYIISPEKTSYDLATLSYNMNHGYVVVVRAVYEIDGQYTESKDSKAVTIKVSGNGSMAGVVYDYDGVTPLSEATVSVVGANDFGTEVSYSYVTAEDGTFGEDMPAGNYTVTVTKDEYKVYTEEVAVEYDKTKTVNVNMQYTYAPIATVNAESDVDIVYVDWAWSETKSETENFESGELGNAWTTNLEYHPWTITEQKKYDGSYSMKSGGKDVANIVSDISIMVNVPADNLVMSFYHKISSETSWDKGFFYIDGVQMNLISGEVDWTYAEYPVTKGYHTFKWSYKKDGSGNSGEDTYYVDNITFYKAKSPEGIDSYSLYRKEKTSEDAVLVASNIKSESYQDDMSELEDGLYQYGVEVYYEGETSLEPYFEEGFEGGAMPTGWTTYTNSSYSEYNWDVSNTCQGYNPSSGSYAAYSNSNKVGTPTSETWLFYMITPQIAVSDENSVLSFEYITPDYYNGGNPTYGNTYVNTLSVKISQSANGPWTDLWSTKASQLTWKNIQLPLEAYNGQEIYIAFVTNRYYSPCSGIDNVVVAKPIAATSNPSIITWSNEVVKGNTFITEGEWNVAENWSKGVVPTENDLAIVNAAATINTDAVAKHLYVKEDASLTMEKNSTLTVSGNFVNEDAEAFIINDGAQVFQNNDNVAATFKMTVYAPTSWDESHAEGWQFISSPIKDINISDFDPEYYDYDLFKYDGTKEGAEWVNYKGHVGEFETTFQQACAYLASYEFTTSVKFAGILNNASTFSKELSYEEDKMLANFHLIGNPFSFDIDWENVNVKGVYDGFATVDPSTGGYVISIDKGIVPVGDGFFVEAIAENPTISYGTRRTRSTDNTDYINVIASSKEGSNNAIVKFSGKEEVGFSKLDNMNPNIAEVYVMNNNKRYSILGYDKNTTEVSLNFDAKEMGSYTISLDVNGEFETVTLVDRFTGIETNMLVEDEYSFIASNEDNANRFVIRLAQGSQLEAQSQFVYQSGEELILSIEGSVQIVDMLGRVVYSNEHANGNNRINVSEFNDASYVVRVVNEEGVKVQKIIL